MTILNHMKTFQLTIARVDMPVFDGPVASVTVPGTAGEMTILAGHVPIVSPLRAGTILIKKDNGEEESINVESGTMEMSHEQLTILI